MKGSQKNNIDIKIISEANLIDNREVLIDLLEENLKKGFPYSRELKMFAVNSYENMVEFQKQNLAIIVGAFKENVIVGFLWAYKRELLGEERIHISHIIVDSTLRSDGVGTMLLSILEDIAMDKGIFKIELMTTVDNEDSMGFYKAKGFSTVRALLERELGETYDNR